MRQLLAFHQEVAIQRNYVKADLGINVEIPLYNYRLNRETISYHCLGNAKGYLLTAQTIKKYNNNKKFLKTIKPFLLDKITSSKNITITENVEIISNDNNTVNNIVVYPNIFLM